VATETGPGPLERRWLVLLQEVVAASAHELKGALNGVALNLEVVRSRSAQEDQAGKSVHRFATSSAEQLELVISMVEGMLGLSRKGRQGEGYVKTLQQLVALLAPAARPLGGSITVEIAGSGVAATPADPLAVRIVLAEVLLAELRARTTATCRVTEADAMVLFIDRSGAVPGPLAEESIAIASVAGIGIQCADDRTVLTFPPVSEGLAG
jgi:signal transduction histidine kinase